MHPRWKTDFIATLWELLLCCCFRDCRNVPKEPCKYILKNLKPTNQKNPQQTTAKQKNPKTHKNRESDTFMAFLLQKALSYFLHLQYMGLDKLLGFSASSGSFIPEKFFSQRYWMMCPLAFVCPGLRELQATPKYLSSSELYTSV